MEEESSGGSRGPSRRTFLVVGGALVAAGAAGGVALGFVAGTSSPGKLVAQVSAELTAAADTERSLINAMDVALKSAHGSHRAALLLVRADHVAHLRAIDGAIADAMYPAVPSASASASASVAASSSVSSSVSSSAPPPANVLTAERLASRTAAARATRLAGAPAVLLASIAAAEASHAELLS